MVADSTDFSQIIQVVKCHTVHHVAFVIFEASPCTMSYVYKITTDINVFCAMVLMWQKAQKYHRSLFRVETYCIKKIC